MQTFAMPLPGAIGLVGWPATDNRTSKTYKKENLVDAGRTLVDGCKTRRIHFPAPGQTRRLDAVEEEKSLEQGRQEGVGRASGWPDWDIRRLLKRLSCC